MILIDEGGNITVTGHRSPWKATYVQAAALGPEKLNFDGEVVLTSCCSSVDDLSESLALPCDMRAQRKGKSAVASFASELPFGAKAKFQTSHRYSENAVRVIKDIQLPPGTELKDYLEVDTLELAGDFEAIRELQLDGSYTDWTELNDSRSWDQHPLMILLRRGDGVVIEIGVGNDIWRWNAGVAKEQNKGAFELTKTDGGLRFCRRPTVVQGDEAIIPVPRIYRFTWYMAWGRGADDLATDRKAVPATWRDKGDIDLRDLADRLVEVSDPVIVIDIDTLPCPDSLLRTNTRKPCLCSSNITKRLKRVVRQLTSFEANDVPILFTGFSPGICMTGRHVDRKQAALHWDLVSLLEFGQWARQSLGSDRKLLVDDGGLCCPSLINLFSVADHDEDAVEYEWAPPKA